MRKLLPLLSRSFCIGLLLFSAVFTTQAQDEIDAKIERAEAELDQLILNQNAKLQAIEALKLERVRANIQAIGIPALADGDVVINHKAMSLCYSEEHEQAKWVVHIVTPDIVDGNVSRTNDFRKDSMVTTETAVKKDYWHSGYDRGHLAPSADFRWSRTALSESYYYSNMSPQKPELNRQSWAKLENTIRAYVSNSNEQVFVVTGGVLTDGLPTIGENKVSIPEYYYKVVLDYEGDEKKGIAFLLPNGKSQYPLFSYAVSIDSVEALTGINLFPALSADEEKAIEGSFTADDWKNEEQKGEVTPLDPTKLEKGQFNTVQAKYQIGNKVTVCGTVVSTKLTDKSKATFLNLDKKFPDQIFTVTIWKDARVNFSYAPDQYLANKKVCVTGKVTDSKGTPTMNVVDESSVLILDN